MRQKALLLLSIFIVFTFGALEKVSANLHLSNAAVFQGILLKSNGKVLPYTEIELVPIDSDKLINDQHLIAVSSSYGKFSFFDVPAGKYTLSINFDDKPTDLSPYPTFFYPNTSKRTEAEVFEINETSRFRNINFRLPSALLPREITGIVVMEDGITMEDAYISVVDVDFDMYKSFSKLKTDANGKFKVKGFEGRTYQIAAILFEKTGKTIIDSSGSIIAAGESKIFTLNSTTPNIKLILKESKDFRRMREKYIGQLVLENETFQNKKY